MENWFTVEKIDNDTYAISEYKHWEETHCYLVCGTEKAVLIDTGLGVAPIPLSVVIRNLMRDPCDFPSDFNVDEYQLFHGEPRQILHDGDSIDLGDRSIAVIHTPGHSPGHCCFYEPQRKYLYSGDLIHSGCLDAFYPTTDPVLFCQSVRKISVLEINRVLPAHHQLSIPVSIIDVIGAAFSGLEKDGLLKQGSGIFEFDRFQIHI